MPPRAKAPNRGPNVRFADIAFLLICMAIASFMVWAETTRQHRVEMALLARKIKDLSSSPPPPPPPPPAPEIFEIPLVPEHMKPLPTTCSFNEILDPKRAKAAIEITEKFFGLPQAPVQSSRGHAQFDMMGPIVSPCRGLETFGVGDDEKTFCTLPNGTFGDAPAPVNASASAFPCRILSGGSKNQFGFEIDIARRTPCFFDVLDCTIKTFAPPPELMGRSKMHKLCIGDPKHQDFISLPQLIGITESKQVDYLKIDIEGSEWPALRELLDYAARIRNATGMGAMDEDDFLPRQIAVEVHTFSGQTNQQLFCMMASLFREGGYVLASNKRNRQCPGCSEALLVRARCGRSMGRHSSCLPSHF